MPSWRMGVTITLTDTQYPPAKRVEGLLSRRAIVPVAPRIKDRSLHVDGSLVSLARLNFNAHGVVEAGVE